MPEKFSNVSQDQLRNVAINLGIVVQLYSNSMDKLLSTHDLSVAQFSILNHLARRATTPQRISDIAQAVEVNQPAVTKIISKFEGMSWVKVLGDKSDRRSRLVAISAAGISHLNEVSKTLAPHFKKCFQDWQADELNQFTQQLGKLAKWYDTNRDL